MIYDERLDEYPLARRPSEVVAGHYAVLQEQPLGDYQIRALSQFFSSSSTAALSAPAASSSSAASTTLPAA